MKTLINKNIDLNLTDSRLENRSVRTLILLFSIILLQACSGAVSTETPGAATPLPETNLAYDSCLQTNSAYVTNGIESADPIKGGQLYDKWWRALNSISSGPTTDQPLWKTQFNNTRSGDDTWRCKECHGWDFQGKDGAYSSGSHFTGFPGVLNAKIKFNGNPTALFCTIHSGPSTQADHAFYNEIKSIAATDDNTKQAILDLTAFILDTKSTTTVKSGVMDATLYINADKTLVSGNTTSGKQLFEVNNNCASCHGVDGKLNAGNHTIGELSSDNPWEVLHKIRFGHPGSDMPAFVDVPNLYTMTEIVDLLAYTATLPINASTPEPNLAFDSCLQTDATFVANNISGADPVRGGKLYDKWWRVLNTVAIGPVIDQPLWQNQLTNTRTGDDTWRCKECHGWDYNGADGAYSSGSHFTGFPGILNAGIDELGNPVDPLDIFCTIQSGPDMQAGHAFFTEIRKVSITDNFAKLAILDLTAFVLDTNSTNTVKSGVLDTTPYINGNKTIVGGDILVGEDLFTNNPINCASSTCHGIEGTTNAGDHASLGFLTNDNPWEVMHKIRFGHPGSPMPGFVDSPYLLSVVNIVNLLTYAKTLPLNTTPDPTDNFSTCMVDRTTFVNTNAANASSVRGGAMYDKWWTALGSATGPTSDQPIWADQTTNTRSGSDTWRCKECHGWDYKGDLGAYATGSHFTGFPGLMTAQLDTLQTAYCKIRSGTTTRPEHRMLDAIQTVIASETNAELAILDMAKFITQRDGTTSIIDSVPYIGSDKSIINGNITSGATLYSNLAVNCASSSCHGQDGTLNAGDHVNLGELADENPWELMHKIRFGNPGSNMPAFIGITTPLSLIQIRDIMAFTQTLFSGVGDPPSSTDTEKMLLGGLLYDNWPSHKNVTPPGDNPIWGLQSTNTRSGSDTWRCKECHGWDYRGIDGVYGSTNNSHYTGFPGIYAATQNSTLDEAYYIRHITNGFFSAELGMRVHNYGTELTTTEVEALAYFIKNGGVIDTTIYISATGRARGDEAAGLDLYTFAGFGTINANCSLCHGANGQAINFGTTANPEYLGDLALGNPWEVFHKARFGQPGPDSTMPGMIQSGLTLKDAVDVLSHSQRLNELFP